MDWVQTYSGEDDVQGLAEPCCERQKSPCYRLSCDEPQALSVEMGSSLVTRRVRLER